MICIDFYRFYPSPRNSLSVSWLVRLFVCSLVTFIFPNFQIFRYFSEFFKVFSRIFRIFPKSLGEKKYVSVSTWKVSPIPRAISIENVRFSPPDLYLADWTIQLVQNPFNWSMRLSQLNWCFKQIWRSRQIGTNRYKSKPKIWISRNFCTFYWHINTTLGQKKTKNPQTGNSNIFDFSAT